MSIITRAYFSPAGAIVNDLLLILQVAKVSTDHWTKIVVRYLRTLAGVDRRERAESKQHKSGESSLDSCHRFAPGGRQILYFCCDHRIIPAREFTKLRASFGNVTLIFDFSSAECLLQINVLLRSR